MNKPSNLFCCASFAMAMFPADFGSHDVNPVHPPLAFSTDAFSLAACSAACIVASVKPASSIKSKRVTKSLKFIPNSDYFLFNCSIASSILFLSASNCSKLSFGTQFLTGLPFLPFFVPSACLPGQHLVNPFESF